MHQVPGEKTATEQRHWYAIYTRPRFEKKVERELTDALIDVFLPQITLTKVWSDRKKKVVQPLFPSYIFVHVTQAERFSALHPQGAVRMVCFNGEPARIPDEQIEAVRRILDSGFIPSSTQILKPGTPVEITAGPLVGLRGIVNEERGNSYFSIFVDGIRQAIAVHVEAHNLKVIKSQQLNSEYMRQLTAA